MRLSAGRATVAMKHRAVNQAKKLKSSLYMFFDTSVFGISKEKFTMERVK
jgi:hypothetical protein